MPLSATVTALSSSSPLLISRRMDCNEESHTNLKDLRKRRSLEANFEEDEEEKKQLETYSNEQQQEAEDHQQQQQQQQEQIETHSNKQQQEEEEETQQNQKGETQTRPKQNDDEIYFDSPIINRGNRSRSLIENRSNVPLGLKPSTPEIDSSKSPPTSTLICNRKISSQEVPAPPRNLTSPLHFPLRLFRQSIVYDANNHKARSLSVEFELNLSMLQEELGYPRVNRTASVPRMRGRSLIVASSSSSTGSTRRSSFSYNQRRRNNSSFLENLSDSFVSILTDRKSPEKSVIRASLKDDSPTVPPSEISELSSPPPQAPPTSNTSTHSSSSLRSLRHRHSVSGPLSSGSFRESIEPEMELGPDGSSNFYVDDMDKQLTEILMEMDDDMDIDGRDEEEEEDGEGDDDDDFLKYRVASVTGYSRGADGVVYYEIIVESILFGPLSAYKVRRRYSEFRDLHRALGTIMSSSGHTSTLTKMLETEPTDFQSNNERLCQSATVRLKKSTLPPLPDQGGLWNFFRGDSPTFLEKRAKYFHAIITAAQNDLVARKSRILHKFLGTPPDSIAMNSSLENSYVSLNRFAAPKLRLSVEVQERKQKAKNISMKRSMAGRPPHTSSTHSMICNTSSASHRPRGIREMYLMDDDPFIAQVEDEINATGTRQSTMTSPKALGIRRSSSAHLSMSSGMINDLSSV